MSMLFSIIASAALAQAMPADSLHYKLPVQTESGATTANYKALPTIGFRQIGMDVGTRMSSKRCLWSAAITVERQLTSAADSTSATRTLPAQKMFEGSRPGDCRTKKTDIRREVASRAPEFKAQLLAIAEADHRTLVSELQTTSASTGN